MAGFNIYSVVGLGGLFRVTLVFAFCIGQEADLFYGLGITCNRFYFFLLQAQ